jgi:pyrroloquinoline quinone (PQQ) biosynthesis protein C
MIGATKSKVSRAESMHKSAMLETYRLCAEALGVTLADIFSEDLSPVERALVQAFRNTPEDRRGIWTELVKLAKADDPTQAE